MYKYNYEHVEESFFTDFLASTLVFTPQRKGEEKYFLQLTMMSF